VFRYYSTFKKFEIAWNKLCLEYWSQRMEWRWVKGRPPKGEKDIRFVTWMNWRERMNDCDYYVDGTAKEFLKLLHHWCKPNQRTHNKSVWSMARRLPRLIRRSPSPVSLLYAIRPSYPRLLGRSLRYSNSNCISCLSIGSQAVASGHSSRTVLYCADGEWNSAPAAPLVLVGNALQHRI